MVTMFSLGTIYAGLFAGLAVLCGSIWLGLRGHTSIAWLTLSLMLGALETAALSFWRGTELELVVVIALLPICYSCFSQALRQSFVKPIPRASRTAMVVGLLTTISLTLLVAHVPYIYQILPFQVACGLPLALSALRLARQPNPHTVDRLLMVCIAINAAIFFVRVPAFPLLFDVSASYGEVKNSDFERVLMGAAGALTAPCVFLLLARVIATIIDTYRTRAETDDLTGLCNRAAFDRIADNCKGTQGTVMFCDIDNFKRINDEHGHIAGDEVIASFGSLLASTGFHAGRVGGEEFAMLLPYSGTDEASNLARRLCDAFQNLRHPRMGELQRVTASFGIAPYGAGTSLKAAFIKADEALYRAKEMGRNRVKVADEGATPAPAQSEPVPSAASAA